MYPVSATPRSPRERARTARPPQAAAVSSNEAAARAEARSQDSTARQNLWWAKLTQLTQEGKWHLKKSIPTLQNLVES